MTWCALNDCNVYFYTTARTHVLACNCHWNECVCMAHEPALLVLGCHHVCRCTRMPWTCTRRNVAGNACICCVRDYNPNTLLACTLLNKGKNTCMRSTIDILAVTSHNGRMPSSWTELTQHLTPCQDTVPIMNGITCNMSARVVACSGNHAYT